MKKIYKKQIFKVNWNLIIKIEIKGTIGSANYE